MEGLTSLAAAWLERGEAYPDPDGRRDGEGESKDGFEELQPRYIYPRISDARCQAIVEADVLCAAAAGSVAMRIPSDRPSKNWWKTIAVTSDAAERML